MCCIALCAVSFILCQMFKRDLENPTLRIKAVLLYLMVKAQRTVLYVLFLLLLFNVKSVSASGAAGEITSPTWKMGISGFSQSIISWEGCASYITGILLWTLVYVVIIRFTLPQKWEACTWRLLEECWFTSKMSKERKRKSSIFPSLLKFRVFSRWSIKESFNIIEFMSSLFTTGPGTIQ